MKNLIDYDYIMSFLKAQQYKLIFYSFESIKNSITIVLSYFHILEARGGHLFSYILYL
jgi:hypothetical protein